jgi:hypothetical protein
MQKEKIYHIYKEDNVVAHNLSFDELCDKIKKDEIDFEEVEILQLSLPQYIDASY